MTIGKLNNETGKTTILKKPIHIQKIELSLKAVKLQCLDENRVPIIGAFGSGFICFENKKYFLYTCWHLVTGFNMHNIEISKSLPNRKFLKLSFQQGSEIHPGIVAIGGLQENVIPLYDKDGKFCWIQDDAETLHFELNNIGLKVPQLHDLIKIELSSSLEVDESQLITENDIEFHFPNLGDKVYIVGYPYGYSVLGKIEPTPIVLTRFVASKQIYGRVSEFLLDGPGAPGMSGSPIFIETMNNISLVGIYTGLIYPDFEINQNDKTTALGTFSFLNHWWFYQNKWPPYNPR